jgi:hypothetical protein
MPIYDITTDRFRQRFDRKVVKTDGCWEWAGARQKIGYGVVRNGTVLMLAHRVAYELAHGPVPEGLNVLHDCDNRGCVNPKHLYAGTQSQNILDAVRRGRWMVSLQETQITRSRRKELGLVEPGVRERRVKTGYGKKLTINTACQIRELYAAGGISQRALGKQFGVSSRMISFIVQNKCWRV